MGFSRILKNGYALGAFAALSLGLFAAGASAEDDVIKLGFLGSLTGSPFTADGTEGLNGAELAVKEINAAGGVAGRKLELLVYDTKEMTPDAVISAFNRIEGNDEISATIASLCSLTNFEIEYFGELGMPYMLATGSQQTYDIIAPNPDGYKNVWSLTPSYDGYETELPIVLEGLIEAGTLNPRDRTVALIGADNPYSMSIYNGLQKSFPAHGWTITFDEVVPPTEVNDWRSLLAKIRGNPPVAVVNTEPSSSNAATFMNQFMEDPTNSVMFIQYAPSVPEFSDLTKANSSGVMYNLLGGAIRSPKHPRTAELAAKYLAEYEIESGTYGFLLYEMVYLLHDCYANGVDPKDWTGLSQCLADTNKVLANGRMVFDPKTHLATQDNDHVPIQFYQIWEGEHVLIYPPKFATGEYKLPPWMTN